MFVLEEALQLKVMEPQKHMEEIYVKMAINFRALCWSIKASIVWKYPGIVSPKTFCPLLCWRATENYRLRSRGCSYNCRCFLALALFQAH